MNAVASPRGGLQRRASFILRPFSKIAVPANYTAMKEDDDIRDVRMAETRRGRPRATSAARQKKIIRRLLRIIEDGTEEELMIAMIDFGFAPDSSEWRSSLTLLRNAQPLSS